MKNKFLTKNTKIVVKEDSLNPDVMIKAGGVRYLTPKPNGLKTAKKVWDEDAKINKDALKAIAKKLEDYYGDELKELDPILKVDGDQEVGSDGVDIFDIEALGAGKMMSLEYEAEGSEVEKAFQKRLDDLNDTSEYDKNFGTKDGFGATDEKDDTYEKMKKASAEYRKYEDEYELPNPLRVKQAKTVKTESKNNKKKTMKRLNFKSAFNTEYEMRGLIPENYKTDGHTFLMTDGNKTYKVRWDDSLKEGTVLGFKNKLQINEDVKKMKKLYNYKYSDSQSKTNDYITETTILKGLLKKNVINEAALEQITNNLEIEIPDTEAPTSEDKITAEIYRDISIKNGYGLTYEEKGKYKPIFILTYPYLSEEMIVGPNLPYAFSTIILLPGKSYESNIAGVKGPEMGPATPQGSWDVTTTTGDKKQKEGGFIMNAEMDQQKFRNLIVKNKEIVNRSTPK